MFLPFDAGTGDKRNQSRPQWAKQSTASKVPEKNLDSSQWNAGIRPGPVRCPVPKLSEEGLRASQRSHRSIPSKVIAVY